MMETKFSTLLWIYICEDTFLSHVFVYTYTQIFAFVFNCLKMGFLMSVTHRGISFMSFRKKSHTDVMNKYIILKISKE